MSGSRGYSRTLPRVERKAGALGVEPSGQGWSEPARSLTF